MRGIVSIAAVLSLPMTLPDGSPFPQRELIVFLTFCVIAVTLVVQGLSLPAVIRKLGVGTTWNLRGEQQRVRAAISAAALDAIDRRVSAEGVPSAWADSLRTEIADRIALAPAEGIPHTPQAALLTSLRHEAILSERRELIRLWRDNQISDEVMHHLEEILDHQEAHL
jgi:CPA1 family monovalent cation:H+ antiporter